MTRIVYKEKCLICIFFVQEVCRIFHELYVGKLLGVAVKQSPNDLIAEGILENTSKLRDLDHEFRGYSLLGLQSLTSSSVCKSSHAGSHDTNKHLTFL